MPNLTLTVRASVALLSSLLFGCEFSQPHRQYFCTEGEEDALACQMSGHVPPAYSYTDLRPFDFCKLDVDNVDRVMGAVFAQLRDEGRYLAVGGYCDFSDPLDATLGYLSQHGEEFDAMVLQVFGCAPEGLATQLESARKLGFDVQAISLRSCESYLRGTQG